MDKRNFHILLNDLKDSNPDSFELIESIQASFEHEVPTITDAERRALRTFPIQFIPRIVLNDGEWTTQLHIWAENGLEDIVNIDPLVLSHKNSYGDTVLMCLIASCTGKFTESVNYQLIKKILETDFTYEDVEKTKEKETIVVKNALDVKDINGQSIIDYLLDFAYGEGLFKDQPQDKILQKMLSEFSEGISEGNDKEDAKEKTSSKKPEVPDVDKDEPKLPVISGT